MASAAETVRGRGGVQRDGGGGEETQARRAGRGRRDDGGEFGRVAQVGHDEEAALGVQEHGVADDLAVEPVSLFAAAGHDAPAARGHALEDGGGGRFQQAHSQRGHPPGRRGRGGG